MAANPNQHWSIDKRIPLAVILGMIGQALLLVVWIYGMDGRISVLENGRYEERLQGVEREIPVIREKINNIERATDRIEKKLDKLSMTWPKKHSSIEPLMMLSLAELGEVKAS